MKKHWNKIFSLGLSLLMMFSQPFYLSFRDNGFFGVSYGAERAAVVSATSLNVRSAPGTANGVVGKLSYGASVAVLEEVTAADGNLWYQIRFTGTGGETAEGYVLGSYVSFSSESNGSTADFEAYLDGQGFPESYRAALRELHTRYPQWVFTAFDTGLDWNEVIQNESLVGRNLVASSSPSSWKSTAPGAYDWTTGTWPGFDGSSWVAASEDIIRYYMDPRNFLNETYIFQFLLQDYDASVHTREGLSSMVKGTFLEGNGTVSGAYQGTGGAGGGLSSGMGVSGNTQPSGTGASGNSAGGALGEGSSNTSQGNSSSVGNYGPGYTQGAASGTQNDAGSASGTQNGAGTNSGTNGSGGFSDVWIGVSPGANLGKSEELPSISHHSVDRVAEPVALVGPGENAGTATETNGMTSGTSSGGMAVLGSDGGSGVVGPGGLSSSSGQGTANPSGSTGFTGTSAPYVDILLEAGAQSGVSPYVLTAMILQEQGRDGKSDSISGTSGYYNFYNFEAYASNGMTAVQRGLWYASQEGSYLRPWNSADKSIIGGALQYGQNYMKAGQNTFYLKKFNVQGTNLYKHQYMTNVEGAAAEGAKMAEAYNASMRQTVMRFSIPVYRNMPETACAKPAGGGSPNNKLQSLTVNGYSLSPAFSPDTLVYDVLVGSGESSVVLYAAAADSTSVIAGTGTIALNTAVTEVKVTVTAQNGAAREYRLRIIKENGISPDGSAGGGTVSPGVDASGGSTQAPSGGPGSSTSSGETSASGNAAAPGSTHTGPGGSNVTIVP